MRCNHCKICSLPIQFDIEGGLSFSVIKSEKKTTNEHLLID
jgi:hypothetical protein